MSDGTVPDERSEPLRFLTLQQVGEELNVQRTTVMGLIRTGELPAIQIGGRGQWRIERTKLEDYITTAYERARAEIARGGQPEDDGGGGDAE
ncbi:helix-turn-helix domain-containing protein (plasmid) [Arthrobacter agilis]|uniref:helix-turn-helix domain-containing protein n=1 Tax=Arthrobacter agilis TaxID=37921 RepID=UPI002365BF8E|nr:helix-turn-helix domain-containing protein [Arthrobacter agilis]WDF35134.1 helix-turn-helix domain-containing protein [Arthrobacter agilis]